MAGAKIRGRLLGGWTPAGAVLALLLVGLAATGCGDFADPGDVSLLADPDYAPVFPPDLPFDPEAWTTVASYPPIGDPRAQRDVDDPLVITWATFPTTLRTDGPNSNSMQTSQIHGLLYESLVGLHPETEAFIPLVASHWKIRENDDGTQTFTFRIDPRAKWSDGNAVTADDVYASWWHRVQEDRSAPSNVMTFRENFQEPEVLDRLTIQVTTTKPNWRLFLYFGGMSLYPARYVRIPGEQYLRDYNWRLMPGSGPYVIQKRGIRKGESVKMIRRNDWWAENEPWAKHTYNFKKIKFTVTREREMEYEKFKKGDLDYFWVSRAQRWVEEIPKEPVVRQGWVLARKIYNQAPEGYNGLVFNMRRPPFNDKRVRLAFAHLFNRQRLMERLFFNEYEYTNSYFPGRDWGNGRDNDPVFFDPVRAEALLAEAGYRERNKEGYLVDPDGKVLEVTLKYGFQGWERIWRLVQEDYEDAGIRFNLKLIDYSTLSTLISERQFRIHWASWGGLLFPNPETSWRSSLADMQANNNLAGFKNARVDELCKVYNRTFDREAQKAITREIDGLVYEEHPYALGWYSNFNRILYWDKFGHPDTYFSKTGRTVNNEILTYWWWDKDRIEALKKAVGNKTKLQDQGEMIVKPWAE